MNELNLYRFMVFIIIVAIVKLLLSDDYGNAIVLMVALVPLLQDLRREHREQAAGSRESESTEGEGD